MFIFEWISGLGSTIMVPVFVGLIALICGAGLKKSARSALLVGIGFIAINTGYSLFGKYLTPASDALLASTETNLTTISVGWEVASGIAFATAIGAFIIPLCLAINLVMLVLNMTKTVNIDIWNFWHYAFTGALVQAISGSTLLGFVAAGVQCAVSLKMGDWAAPKIQEVLELPGVSIPQAYAVSTVPVGFALDWLYDKIPGFKKVRLDPDGLDKLGFLGEPSTIGFLLGFVMSLIGRLPIKDCIVNGIGTAALLVITPRMVKILMEGLMPISVAARNFVNKHFKDRDLYIGMDSAITLGHPTTLAVAGLMIPCMFILAIILPYNTILPAALTGAAYSCCMFTAVHKGDVIRTLISTMVHQAILWFFGSIFAPVFTDVAASVGYSYDTQVAYPGTWITGVLEWFATMPLGVAIALTLAFGVAMYVGFHLAVKADDKKRRAAEAAE